MLYLVSSLPGRVCVLYEGAQIEARALCLYCHTQYGCHINVSKNKPSGLKQGVFNTY